MQKVRVKFVNMWEGFDPISNPLMKIFEKKNEILLVENDPDFIICSSFRNRKDKIYEYCNYDCVRIFLSLENFEPDYNLFDYTVTTSYANNLDRSCRLPNYLVDIFRENYKGIAHSDVNKEILKTKDRFCNLIFSHDRDDSMRRRVAEELSNYKKVDAAGTYFNNMDNGQIIKSNQKLEFQSRYKFSIVLESTDQPGFTTEKIWDAYKANTIPIYCGDKYIQTELNKKAYIDIRDFDSLVDLRKQIEKIDCDDSLFLEILSQPLFNDLNYAPNKIHQCEDFFAHIFEQGKIDAYRRPMGPKVGLVKYYENILKICNKLDHSHVWKIIEKIDVRTNRKMKG